jgi:hypothetical protein
MVTGHDAPLSRMPRELASLASLMAEVGSDGASMEYYDFSMWTDLQTIADYTERAAFRRRVTGADIVERFVGDAETLFADEPEQLAKIPTAAAQLRALVGDAEYDQYTDSQTGRYSYSTNDTFVRVDWGQAFRFEAAWED